MKKITGAIAVLILLLCAFSAQAASEVSVSVPSAGEACSNDLDCTLGGSCVEDICVPSVGDPCSNDLDCGPDGACIDDICVPSGASPCSNDLDCAAGEVCIDEICVPGECASDIDCDEGLFCDTSSYLCVECLTSSDCQEGESCFGNTCVQAGYCDVTINPPRININKKKNPPYVRTKRLRVKGDENFDPSGEISVNAPLILWDNTIRRKPNHVRFILDVTLDPMPDVGFYPIRVGNCIGEIELYDKRAK